MTGPDMRDIIARNLKRLRREQCLTQAMLADRAGVSGGYVSDIETSKRWPSAETLCRLAEVLGIAPFQLMLPTDDSPYFDRRRVLSSYHRQITEAFERSRDEVYDRMIGGPGAS